MANATEMPSFKMLCTNNNEFTGGAAHSVAAPTAARRQRTLSSQAACQQMAEIGDSAQGSEAMGVSNSGLIEMQFLSRVMVPLS